MTTIQTNCTCYRSLFFYVPIYWLGKKYDKNESKHNVCYCSNTSLSWPVIRIKPAAAYR